MDDDRYWIDGQYRQVLLSPRELNTASLPTRNFINERLTFTHGMGLTLSPVNQVTEEGLPVLFIKDLPPTSSVSLTVRRPAIYFGELSSDYVFVKTGQPEFDFPSGDSSSYTQYAASGGVPVASWLRRLVLSIDFGSTQILFSNGITDQSRVLYHRNVRERAATALPFLRWDGDPYLVIREDGRLQWILDAYTDSDRYPYAEPLDTANSDNDFYSFSAAGGSVISVNILAQRLNPPSALQPVLEILDASGNRLHTCNQACSAYRRRSTRRTTWTNR